MPFQKSGSFIAVGVLQQPQKAYCDSTSIPGFVIKKNSSRGPKHGASERQIMWSHPTILARWYAQERYRDSLAKHIIGEKKSCFLIASPLKDSIVQLHELNVYRTPNIGFLCLNADGPQMHLRQRPEFAVEFKQCLEMQDAHLAETQRSLRPIRPEHQQRQRQDQQFCKDNTSNDPFSRCKSVQQFGYR